MAEFFSADRCKLAAQLIEQAPPGELNDVINDIRAIIADDTALMPHILPSLRSYNLAQLHTVEHSAANGVPAHTSILSNATVLPGSGEQERYVDAEGKRSFAFDHVQLAASEYEPYELPEEEGTFRAELARSLSAYTKNHFPSGQTSVSCSQHPLLPPAPPAPAQLTPPVAAAPIEPAVVEKGEMENPVTDVVPEQVAAGDAEPMSTPAVGDISTKTEEVDQPGGLEKVDEKVEEAQEAEEGLELAEEEKDEIMAGVAEESRADQTETKADEGEEPVVEESKPEEEPIIQATSLPQAVESEQSVAEERKQERVENPVYTLEIVGNRYNPSNFWTGRWRTQWVVDKAAEKVDGTILVDVHYYEQGNVQLATRHSASFPCPSQSNGSQSIASHIVTTISKIETTYHMELNDVYGELGEKAFRALRRALPVTRQKMEWEKVSGYSLGSDLTKARA